MGASWGLCDCVGGKESDSGGLSRQTAATVHTCTRMSQHHAWRRSQAAQEKARVRGSDTAGPLRVLGVLGRSMRSACHGPRVCSPCALGRRRRPAMRPHSVHSADTRAYTVAPKSNVRTCTSPTSAACLLRPAAPSHAAHHHTPHTVAHTCAQAALARTVSRGYRPRKVSAPTVKTKCEIPKANEPAIALHPPSPGGTGPGRSPHPA